MLDNRLLSYVQQQLQAGYTATAIRTALLQGGYPPQTVDETFQCIKQQKEQLIAYCKQYLSKGYSAQQIQQFLVQNQYPQQLVEEALVKAQKKPFQYPKLSSKMLLFSFISLLILAIVVASFWFFLNTRVEEQKEVDFVVSIDIDTLAPGETIYITNDFIDFPGEREASITLYYTINEKETQTRVDSWQLSMGVADALIKNTKRTILQTFEPGEYELNVKMNYGTLSKKTSAYFTVFVDEKELKKAETVAVEEVKEEKEVEEPVEKTPSEESYKVVETTYETNVIGEDDYLNLATAKELAETDSISATAYCNLIVSMTKKDDCYWAVARLTENKTYCESIVSDPTRDSCWMTFALDKQDYTVCDNITNPFIKQNCKSQEKVTALSAQYMQ